MICDYEANHEITLTLTKKELYEARMAMMIMKITNSHSNDPTVKARVEFWDALEDKLVEILYTSK